MDVKRGWRIWLGLTAGLGFGLLDILPMLMLEFPNRTVAMSSAFASRFAIGFLIPQVMLPLPAWVRGLLVALLISTPDAIITGSYQPIFTTGAVGGVLIGALTGWLERRKQRVLEPI
jgi:hypothetical protein